MAVIVPPVDAAVPVTRRRWRQPRGGYGDLDRPTRGFLTKATVTLFAIILVVAYLLPLAYGFITGLKSPEQMSDPRQPILPMSPETATIDGEEYPIMVVPFEKLIMASLIAAIILPRFATIVPTYAVYQRLGWIGTWLPLIVPHFFANAFNVFLLRQFFMTIPRELDEAATIDGAGPLRILMTIIIPQARAAIVAVALFHFFFAWNDFFEPFVYLAGDRDKYPISIGLYSFVGLYKSSPNLIMAGAMIAMAIPIAVFIFGQRFFTKGIDISGSLK